MAKFRNMSNPAAFGAEWTDSEGSRFQLCNPRGTASLMMGFWNADRGRWYNTSVAAPERFGMTSAPKSWREFAGIVTAFIDGARERG
jgi:hypothetical protein